eukprot:TRINITY_DN11425_c0_g1_i1.p1 TRINITY_DN11425_c0_g1~~TRINITY_DN11425_c0_g1_i1.p1  ORF type:complete len:294 (-),score=53.04 TRINITY_DN11425_c0_g1_i1:693-1574(-)
MLGCACRSKDDKMWYYVFCYPCILHYLEMGEKPYQRCPLCFENVYKRDIKSVLVQKQSKRNVGDFVNFTLLKRLKQSVVPFKLETPALTRTSNPNPSCSSDEGTPAAAAAASGDDGDVGEREKEKESSSLRSHSLSGSVKDEVEIEEFSRIVVTSDISELLHMERKQLYEALQRADEIFTAPYIHIALSEIAKRESEWNLKTSASREKADVDISKRKHHNRSHSGSSPQIYEEQKHQQQDQHVVEIAILLINPQMMTHITIIRLLMDKDLLAFAELAFSHSSIREPCRLSTRN